MPLVNSNHLKNWATELHSRGSLPLLIGKLIWATVYDAEIDFPFERDISESGFDGTVYCNEGYSNVPKGMSVWEVGTSKDCRKKAEEDYKKRVNDKTIEDKSQVTLVIVNLNPWDKGNREKWYNEKLKDRIWYDIKIYDGPRLSEWLDHYSTVDSWLAQELRNKTPILPPNPATTESLEYFWKRWSNNYLPHELLLAGRQEYSEKIIRTLRAGNPGLTSIKGPNIDEVIAFIAACINQNNRIEERTRINSRALIISSLDSFKELTSSGDFQILIPKIIDDGVINLAAKNKLVIQPLNISYDNPYGNVVELPNLMPDEVYRIFIEKLNYDDNGAKELVHSTNCELSILRRRLKIENRIPKWMEGEAPREVIPALLMGQWDETIEGDRNLIITLSNSSKYNDYHSKILKWWDQGEDTFVKIHKNEWRVVSTVDGFANLSQHLTSEDFANLNQCVTYIINDFKKNEPDKLFSRCVKKGVLINLVLIADNKKQVFPHGYNDNQEYVNHMIGEISVENDGFDLNELCEFLQLLAEASPFETLSLINTVLEASSFKFEQFKLLINSLGVIAFIPNNLSFLTNTIAKIYSSLKDEKFKRPLLGCSERIFRVNKPQTYADYPEMFNVLSELNGYHNNFLKSLWDRLVGQEIGGQEIDNLSPKLRKNVNHRNEEFKDRKAMEYLQKLSKLVVEDD